MTPLFDSRPAGWLLTAAAAIVVIAVVAWYLRRRPRGQTSSPEDRLDTLAGWPPTATRLLTPAERKAFAVLQQALPDCVVLSQVPLARFIEVPKRNSYSDWLRRVGYQSIDFLVCDGNTQVLAAVELHPPPAQASPRALKRQMRIARILKAAKVPLHIWALNDLPSAELARDSILGRPVEPLSSPMPLDGPSGEIGLASPAGEARRPVPSPTAGPATAPGAARARNPFDEDDRDSTLDELIEAREPPQTTWFDDLDSGPAPLAPTHPQRRR